MRYSKFIAFVSIIVFITGLLVMTDWLLNVSILKAVFPDDVTMKFNTAVCFALCGAALYLKILEADKFWRRLSAAISLIVLSIGLFELCQKLFDYNLRIDFFSDENFARSTADTLNPGMMSPFAAICFILFGSAMLGIKSKNKMILSFAQAQFNLITLISFIEIVAYWLRVSAFSSMSFLASMAVLTALAFFFLSIAASLIYPHTGITGLFTGSRIGNKMARSLFLQFAVITLILAYLRIEFRRNDLLPDEFGIALFATSFILVIHLLLHRATRELNSIERKKSATEKKLLAGQEMQEGLQKLKEQFLTFFNMNPGATIITTCADNKIWYANGAFLKQFSYDKGIIGKTACEINLLDNYSREELLAQFEKEKSIKDFEIKSRDGEGKIRNIILSVDKIDFDGTDYWISSIMDITDRIELSNRLKLATQNASIGIWDYDLVNDKAVWDDYMFQMYGVGRGIFSKAYHIWQSAIHPDDRLFAETEFAKALSGEQEFDTEFRIIRPDGSVRHIKAKAVVQRDSLGMPLRILGTNWDITSQKLAEAEAKQSNQRNRIFIEQAPLGLAMFDNEMRYMAASRQWITDYNLSGKDIIGQSLYEILPEISDDWKEIHRSCLEGAVNQNDGAPFERSDGRVQWVSWDVRPWYASEGAIGGLLMYAADITHVREKDKEKRRIEEIFDKVNDVARIGTWDVDLVAGRLIWSRIVKEICEVPPDYETSVATAIDFYAKGENQLLIQQAMAEAVENGKAFDVELQMLTARGNHVWVRSIGRPEFENGKCIRIFGIFQDINEKKKAERSIAEERQLLKTLVDNLPLNVHIKNLASRKILVNRKECEYMGMKEEDILGKTDFELYPPDIAHNSLAEDQQVFASGQPIEFKETINLKNDGAGAWFITSKIPLYNDKNEITSLLGIEFDITTRKQTEEHRNRLLNEMQSIMDATKAVAIISTDISGNITHFNKGAERLLGYSSTDVTGKATPLLFHLETEITKRSEELTSMYGRHIDGFDVLAELASYDHPEALEWAYIRKDGSTFPVQLIMTAIYNKKGLVTGFLSVATDLTERKESEKRLVNYSILESKSKEVEQFTYIASHDLREPLLTIKNYIEQIMEDYEGVLDEAGKKYTLSIFKAVTRMELLISGLLDHSRLSKLKELQVIDCNSIVTDVKEDLNSLIRNHQAKIVIARKLPVLKGYSLELKLLFQNLVSNAIKFRKKLIPPEVSISAEKIINGWQFSIEDNGIGIEEKNQEKIFILFQRLHSRTEYEGIGIGLAHCKKIAELHNGKIWVESNPGLSSTFYFTILTENL